MRKLMLLISFCLLGVVPVQAATFFDTDFEAGSSVCDWTANGWLDFGQAPCSSPMTISTAKAFSGTKSLRLQYTSLDNTHCVTPCPSIYQGPSTGFPARTHLFVRFAIFIPGSFQGSPYNTKLIRVQGGSVYPRLWISFREGVYQAAVEGPYDYPAKPNILSTGTAPRRDQWDQVELEWQLNSCGNSDGLMKMWVNGVLKMSSTGRAWRGNGANAQGAVSSCAYPLDGMQVYLQNGAGTLYYDRIAAGDTRIGLVGGAPPPPGDTTAPGVPTGLSAN